MRATLKNISFSLVFLAIGSLSPLFAFADDATSTPPDASSTPPVVLVDSTSPVIVAPADQSFATTTFPASPVLTLATATDDTDPNPVITYAPLTFSLGTTSVTWTATDASGNFSTATSNVVITDSSATSTAPLPLVIEGNVDVPANCEVTDTDGATHDYEATATSSYVAICALQAAKDSGLISAVGLSNQFPSFGLFVLNINDVTADPSSQYWALYQNGSFASLGLTSLPVAAGDTVMLQLHDFSDNPAGDQLTLHINSLISDATSSDATSTPPEATSTPSEPVASSGSSGNGSTHFTLNIPLALQYISGQQSADGSFSGDGFTDWTALAFAAADPGDAKTKLKNYLLTAAPTMSSITDYERHAMALEALGINPYNGTPVDYITPIVNAFDGTKIGGVGYVNADSFALFALLHAGYSESDNIIQKEVAFILSQQQGDGSWGDPDTTAAAVQALQNFPGTAEAISRADQYLTSQEQNNASWNSVDSTSWVQTMINAEPDHKPDFLSSAGFLPNDSIYYAQQQDGSVKSSTPVWSTGYGVVASSGKGWMSLLQSFPKPTISGNGIGIVLGASTSTVMIATSTQAMATSTHPIATSTPPIATSTSEIIGTLNATVATSTPPKKPHKNSVVKHISAPVATGTTPIIETAAAVVPTDGFFGAIIRFLSHIFHF